MENMSFWIIREMVVIFMTIFLANPVLRLSDRIWMTTLRTRKKRNFIDNLLLVIITIFSAYILLNLLKIS